SKRIRRGLRVYQLETNEVDPDRRERVTRHLEANLGPALARLKKLEAELNSLFIAKQEIIKMVIVSAIANQPMLLIGPPGTAKSKIILKFCEGLGVGRVGESADGEGAVAVGHPDPERPTHSVFQYLLHGFTEPDEILGPVLIEKLRQDKPEFRRLREGSITDAEVIFLDEVFRANSAILNALLSVINERQVFEGGQAIPAKVRMIYGASNSTPSGRQLQDLRAFYERFILRMESTFVPMDTDGESGGPSPERQELLRRGWAGEVRDLRASYRPQRAAMEPVSCLNDVLLLNRAVCELWGGEKIDDLDILPIYQRLVATLSGGDILDCVIDDRKFIRLFLVVRAHALYEHQGPPRVDDLIVLKHTWDDVDSKVSLGQTVTKFIDAVKADG
ncbi:MAG: AAA family ATPase, partial [Thermoanaerobaculia bacterium]